MTKARALVVVAALAALSLPSHTSAQQQLGRILGVLDKVTGQPLAGAEVVDLATGTKAVTSSTGTISLAWLSPGTSVLQVRKLGYANKIQTVATSATDTGSVTVALTPLTQSLPAVVTRARAVGDTVRRLDLTGFYERKRSSGAPESAFVSGADLEKWKVLYLGDVRFHTGRGICPTIYLNGSPITGGVWQGPGDSGLKLRIEPDEVAGIEMYTHVAELPAQFNGTAQRGARAGCVTVIWLK